MFHVESRGESVSVLRMEDGKVNAIGPEFLDEVGDAWRRASEGGRAIVLAGGAKAYSAGFNLRVLPTLDPPGLVKFLGGFGRMLGTMYAHPRPVVTAVDGPAMAGGAFLALCGDVRLATPKARIGLTEMAVGIPFPRFTLSLARNEIPPHEIGPAIFQGVVREGEAACERGWVHRIVPRERLLDEAVATAAELADFNPRAYAAAKETLRGAIAREAAAMEKDADAYVGEVTHPETIGAIVRYFERVTSKK